MWIILLGSTVFGASKAELIATGILQYKNGQVITKAPYSYGKNSLPWSKTKKGIENALGGYTKFEDKGLIYEYTGDWTYEDGSKVDFSNNKITLQPNDDEEEYYTVTISPVYSATLVKFLQFDYIDNISTGSGSWSNQGSFDSFTHTFKQPDDKAHYKFVEWKNEDTGKTYQSGDTYTISIDEIEANNPKVVQIYAYWKPSITLNYYDEDGTLLQSDEQFTNVAVDNEGPSPEGKKFIGWFIDEENVTGNVYDAPEVTNSPIDKAVIDVYAKYETIPEPVGPGQVRPEPEPEPAPTPTVKPEQEPTVEPETPMTPIIIPEPTVKPEPVLPTTPKEPAIPPVLDDDTSTPENTEITPEVQEQPETTVDPDPAPSTSDTTEVEPQTIIKRYITQKTIKKIITTKPQIIYRTINRRPTIINNEYVTKNVYKTEEVNGNEGSTTIEEQAPPLATPSKPHWALINVILTILIVLFAAFVIFVRNKKRTTRENSTIKRTHRILSFIMAILTVILCLLTEDFSAKMQLVDQWTILMAIFFVDQLVVTILNYKMFKTEK